LAFAVLKRTGIYPAELHAVNIDSDWFYRRLPRLAWSGVIYPVLDRIENLSQSGLTQIKSLTLTVPEIRGPSVLSFLVVFLLFCIMLVSSW
jgi:hypothetical protein